MTSAPVSLLRLVAAEFFGSAFPPAVVTGADDHKACSPGSRRIVMRFTGDRPTIRLLGRGYPVICMCTPPSGSPWGAVQSGGADLARQLRLEARNGAVTPKGKELS